MGILTSFQQKAKALKTETYTVYFALRNPKVPWYAKAFIALVIGYAMSPIDLIPDFIPVLGYVDDLVIVPAGIFLALKMIPGEVLQECREKAKSERIGGKTKWIGILIIVLIWLLIVYFLVSFMLRIVFHK